MPTFRGTEVERIARNERGARMVAKVVRELLHQRPFTNPVELKDALEDRCRALGLAADKATVERALDLVGSNAQLFTANRRPASKPAPAVVPAPAISHAEAKGTLDALGIDLSGGRLRRRGTSRSRLVQA